MPSLTSVYRTGERYVERELLSPESAMGSAFFYVLFLPFPSLFRFFSALFQSYSNLIPILFAYFLAIPCLLCLSLASAVFPFLGACSWKDMARVARLPAFYKAGPFFLSFPHPSFALGASRGF